LLGDDSLILPIYPFDIDVDERSIMQQVEIRIRGQLDESRSSWFEGMIILQSKQNQTIIAGSVVDQPALFGVLSKIRDLGLDLISLEVIDPEIV
jgi:hypothetical protein